MFRFFGSLGGFWGSFSSGVSGCSGKFVFFFFLGIFDKLFVFGSLGVFLVLIIFFKGKKIVYNVEIYNGR